jgi:steroid 5-alpha reductase family enzyme
MKKIVPFLMATVILLPIAAYFLGTPPNELQINIIKKAAVVLGVVIGLTFIVGQITGNNSQVDKLWSIVPAIYAWYMTGLGGWDEKMILMSVLVSIWAARLTFNFARRGGYSWKFWEGEEDYRWEVLRKRPGFKNPIVWMLFNLMFICFYQNTLIFLFTIPVLSPLSSMASSLTAMDFILALVFIVLVVIEFIADQQQYNFQTEKYRRIEAGEAMGPYADGFIQTGLWSRMRHPNYAAEQAIWIVFYLFSVSLTGEWLNWTIAGSVLLVILFKGSSDFSEEISAKKYPKYKEYQERVGRFIPKFW